MLKISDMVCQYKLNNHWATEKNLDEYTIDLMQITSNNNIKQKSNGSSDIFGFEINYAEKQLMTERPSQWAAYFWCSSVADKEAKSRYTENSCWWDGNGDAFRHTYWSAILMKRFNELFGYSASKCATITEEWTNAHEAGDTSLSSKMDIENNINGRAIGYSLYSYAYMCNETQDYIDRGFCVRIQDVNGQRKLVPTDTTEKK